MDDTQGTPTTDKIVKVTGIPGPETGTLKLDG
jgi:hypothetical protein